MIFRKYVRFFLAGWFSLAGVSWAAGSFAPPASGPVAFRRDRLPLEVERLRELSRDMEILARGMAPELPEQRQSIARMLALAVALDPGNATARELIAAHEKGTHTADTTGVPGSRDRAWKIFGWLRSPEAGAGGTPLADCLGDVLLASAPEDPRAADLKTGGERGAWRGWVPELSAYEVKPVESPPAGKPPETKNLLLTGASLVTPLWQMDPATNKWVLNPVTVTMSAADAGSFGIVIRSRPAEAERLASLGASLTGVLEKYLGTLPKASVIIAAGSNGDYRFSKNKEDITAAAAVLAGAAVTGKKPAGCVIGLVDREGALTLPRDFFAKLFVIDTSHSGRLVLPEAAAEYLPARLVMGDPGFFLRHEVLLAADFKELSQRLAESPEGPLAGASAKFSEIVKRQAGQPLGQYLMNRFVREKLAQISLECPWHYSARMLALQGSGERPRYLPGKALACELRAVINPMAWMTGLTVDTVTAELGPRLDTTYDSCDSALEKLKPYIDPADDEFYGDARDLVAKVRALSRATRLRNQDLYTGNPEITPALAAFLAAHGRMKVEISDRLGETVPDPENPDP